MKKKDESSGGYPLHVYDIDTTKPLDLQVALASSKSDMKVLARKLTDFEHDALSRFLTELAKFMNDCKWEQQMFASIEIRQKSQEIGAGQLHMICQAALIVHFASAFDLIPDLYVLIIEASLELKMSIRRFLAGNSSKCNANDLNGVTFLVDLLFSDLNSSNIGTLSST